MDLSRTPNTADHLCAAPPVNSSQRLSIRSRWFRDALRNLPRNIVKPAARYRRATAAGLLPKRRLARWAISEALMHPMRLCGKDAVAVSNGGTFFWTLKNEEMVGPCGLEPQTSTVSMWT